MLGIEVSTADDALALLAADRLERDLRGGLVVADEVAVEAQPVHVAAACDLLLADSGNVVPGGSIFVGWSKDVPSSCKDSIDPCTVTMDSNQKVDANYDRICPTGDPLAVDSGTAPNNGLRLDCSDLAYRYRFEGNDDINAAR